MRAGGFWGEKKRNKREKLTAGGWLGKSSEESLRAESWRKKKRKSKKGETAEEQRGRERLRKKEQGRNQECFQRATSARFFSDSTLPKNHHQVIITPFLVHSNS